MSRTLPTRVERRNRVLEDHLHACAGLAHVVTTHLGELASLEDHRSTGRPRQLHDGPAGGALAAARFADDAQSFAAQHIEADPADCIDLQAGATDRELDDEILDAQQHIIVIAQMRLAGAGHQAATSASRRRRSLISWYSGEPTGYQQAYVWRGSSTVAISGGSSSRQRSWA